jgi:hypothetical protein
VPEPVSVMDELSFANADANPPASKVELWPEVGDGLRG